MSRASPVLLNGATSSVMKVGISTLVVCFTLGLAQLWDDQFDDDGSGGESRMCCGYHVVCVLLQGRSVLSLRAKFHTFLPVIHTRLARVWSWAMIHMAGAMTWTAMLSVYILCIRINVLKLQIFQQYVSVCVCMCVCMKMRL
jgi:hypothetical protein